MTTGSVLDILIYVFDHYMLADDAHVPGREHLARDLRRAGFTRENVEQALDWLTDLAFGNERPPLSDAAPEPHAAPEAAPTTPLPSVRVFADSELARLAPECRGYLLSLVRQGVLTAQQREVVIERALALPGERDIEQLKWVVLLVLSSQPGQELALARLSGLMMAELPVNAPH
jgi:Smg protein